MTATSNRVLTRPQIAPPPVVDSPPIERHGLPTTPIGTVPRVRLNQSLTAAATAAITVVRAPTGAGKTIGVAAWAARLTAFDAVIWLPADALAHDVLRFWHRLCSALTSSGAGSMPPLPQHDSDAAAWSGWISAAAWALSKARRRWLIVLDDFPVGSPHWLGDQVGRLASRSMGAVRVVITASDSPAIDLSRVEADGADGADGACAIIGPERLTMDDHEVAAVLASLGVRASSDTVALVTAHTRGWARGVALAARLIGSAADRQAPGHVDLGQLAGIALDDLDRALDNLVAREVLDALPPAGRELVIRTSVAAEVTPGLASAVLGPDQPHTASPVEGAKGFVDQGLEGFRCHPLLRRSARRRLDTDWPALARSACRSAAAWHLAGGRDAEGIALAAQVDDPAWLARVLVDSLAVPLIAVDHVKIAPGTARWHEVELAEPLVLAATATARGDVAGAEAILDQSRPGVEEEGASGDATRRLTRAMIAMAIARHRADPDRGLAVIDDCRRLVARLGSTARTADLVAVIDFHQAAFMASRGELEPALTVLGAACDATTAALVEDVALADQVGLSAWLHAMRGDLTVAARQAASVLTARTADRDEAGVGYAQLATAWVHLERRELDQARQRLGHASRVDARHRDRWLVAGCCLTEARLATAGGDPDLALRTLAAVSPTIWAAAGSWLADRLTLARAEAHLVAGDHQQALATLTPEPRRTLVEARVLAAAARRAVGDRRGAQALLAAVDGRLASAALPAAVQVWALSAQLAAEAGNAVRARSLVERALRAAERETLRLSLSSTGPWLSTYLDRDVELRRLHRGLVDSVRRVRDAAVGEPTDLAHPPGEALEALTERELQVLERLAQLSTTEEIAAELYLSPNTVKTHVKNVFLKLAVNRRSDAVRQGRRLGLC